MHGFPGPLGTPAQLLERANSAALGTHFGPGKLIGFSKLLHDRGDVLLPISIFNGLLK
jgi:hypothetical protein